MKKTLYAAATIASFLLCACNKQENNAASQGNAVMTFYGTIEQADTKTVLTNDLKVNWEERDCIVVNGYDALGSGERVYGEEFTATPDSENPTKATFTSYLPMSETITPPYQAYFPSDLWARKVRVPQLPANQQYIPGKFVAPMYAESDDEYFQFHNLCGVLHFALKGMDCSVESIVVTAADDEIIWGNFSVSDGKDIHMATSSNVNRVILQISSDVPLNSKTPTDFYVYLPPHTYKPGMTMTIYRADGTTYTKTTKKDFTVERNNIYTFNWNVGPTRGTAKANISGREVDVPWVQLWENGPRFAKYNIGVTDGKEYATGEYYSWGGYIHRDHTIHTQDFTDTATYLWGDNWRMPTYDEVWSLRNLCDSEERTLHGVNGLLVTGRGDYYSGNSIFLPDTGYYNVGDFIPVYAKTDGYYWTSTSYSDDDSYGMLTRTMVSWNHALKSLCYCVRAVLNEL